MAMCCPCRSRLFALGSIVATGRSLCAGSADRPRTPHGSCSRTSHRPTPTFSSRTSCFIRRGEVLWTRLLAAPISVARRANQQELLQMQNRKAKGRRS
uniref:Uncharacterized protein n=1 Tax=Arundo donax TaxID=35708 RepID=A0A0A9GZQ1_ARUDO